MSFNIAIDGPSGAGKSSVSKAVSKKLGFIYVDTGALYRTVGLYIYNNGIDPDNTQSVISALDKISVKFDYINGEQHVFLNDTDVTEDASGSGTHQVGKKSPNRLGIYDMSGNVSEWCYDWYGTIKPGTESNPTGEISTASRVYRGGSWYYGAKYSSVLYRCNNGPHSGQRFVGFRVVRSCASTTE